MKCQYILQVNALFNDTKININKMIIEREGGFGYCLKRKGGKIQQKSNK